MSDLLFPMSQVSDKQVNSYRNRVNDVLGEEDALELDQEKVHKLLQILQHALDGILRDGVVFTRTE